MRETVLGGVHDGGAQYAPDGSLRPPWSSEDRVRHSCTACSACLRACPESILIPGRAGTPVVDFNRGACSFCKACAEACPEGVFDLASPAWSLTAEVRSACLLNAGVSCRTCTDVCEERALRFDLRAGSVGRVSVFSDACTGCGACLSVCPVGAVALSQSTPAPEATV